MHVRIGTKKSYLRNSRKYTTFVQCSCSAGQTGETYPSVPVVQKYFQPCVSVARQVLKKQKDPPSNNADNPVQAVKRSAFSLTFGTAIDGARPAAPLIQKCCLMDSRQTRHDYPGARCIYAVCSGACCAFRRRCRC